jgi:hypothetical protein
MLTYNVPVSRFISICRPHCLLQLNGARYSVNGAAELNEDAIPHQLDDAATVFRNLRLENL